MLSERIIAEERSEKPARHIITRRILLLCIGYHIKHKYLHVITDCIKKKDGWLMKLSYFYDGRAPLLLAGGNKTYVEGEKSKNLILLKVLSFLN